MLPAAVAPSSSTVATRVVTASGLEQVIAAASRNADRPVLVEAVLTPRDMAPLLAELAPAVRPLGPTMRPAG